MTPDTNTSHARPCAEIADLRKKVADLEVSLALELKENPELFGLLGLDTAADFANDTATAAIRRKVADLRKELGKARAACAEMRARLVEVLEDGRITQLDEWQSIARQAISSDSGKDYVPKAELDEAQKDVARLDWIEAQTGGGGLWVARDSVAGFYLHNAASTANWPRMKATAREAIDAAMAGGVCDSPNP